MPHLTSAAAGINWATQRLQARGLRTLDRARALLDRQALQLSGAIPDTSPVFVLSTGRAGTMTLAHLLALSPRLRCAHEPSPRLLEASALAAQPPSNCFDARFFEDAVRTARGRDVRRCRETGRAYVETNNRLTFLARALDQAFPDARFIHVLRRPASFVRSGIERGYYVDHPWDYVRARPYLVPVRDAQPDEAAWQAFSQAERCAWLWRVTNAYAEEFMAERPPARCLRLEAEALFAQDAQTIETLFQFTAGHAAPPQRLINHVLSRKLNRAVARTGSALDAEKRHTLSVADQAQIDTICAPLATRLGLSWA